MTEKERGGACDAACYQKTTTGFSDSTHHIATSTRPRRALFTLRLEGRGDAGDIRHLRWVLKSLLRRHGFRCLDCIEEPRP
jgi:hypothetical protein